jgi:hypothetical protein
MSTESSGNVIYLDRMKVTLTPIATQILRAEMQRQRADYERWTNLIDTFEDPGQISPEIEAAWKRREPQTVEALVSAAVTLYCSSDNEQEIERALEVLP